ncbi:MAG: DUF554 domain-containing protein [Erysipelotrichaceae bacterium]
MIGTIVNATSIALGALIGLGLKKGIKQSYQDSLNQALGLAVFIVGLNGILTNMLSMDGTTLKSDHEMVLIVSLALGVLIGEVLKIDDRLNSIAGKLEKRFHLSSFSTGFVNASLVYCVGAMAIVGSLNEGLLNDPSVLFLKSALDGISSILLSATLGLGVVFSAIPVFIYQGSITLLAGFLEPILQGELLVQICMVGYVLVMSIGLNFMKVTNIKIANFLPAILLPIIVGIWL